MALTDVKEFEIRGKKVFVTIIKTGERTYDFVGLCQGTRKTVNSHLNPHGKPVDAAQMQAWVDEARMAAADEAVKAVEHSDLEGQID